MRAGAEALWLMGDLPASEPDYHANCRFSLTVAMPLRGNLFDNVVVMKHEGHCATPQMITDETKAFALTTPVQGILSVIGIFHQLAQVFRSTVRKI
jgi:hypothetical protein